MDDLEFSGVEETEIEDAAQSGDTGDETGEIEDADAEQVAEDGEEEQPEPKQEVAFAKRLAAERKKLEKEIAAKLESEFEAKYAAKEPKPAQQATPPQLPADKLEELADQLGVTKETAWAIYAQQWELNQTKQLIQQQAEYLQQRQQDTAKTEAMREVARMRKDNQNLPPFDDTKLNKIRSDFKKETGAELPWKLAYRQLAAEEVLSGKVTRATEQKVLSNITARDRQTVQAGGGGKATPKLPADMNDEEFARFDAAVQAGKMLSPEARKRRNSGY